MPITNVEGHLKNHSTTLVPGHAAAAPGSATPELDSTHMNGLIDDKKRSVVPTVQSKVCVRVRVNGFCQTINGTLAKKQT